MAAIIYSKWNKKHVKNSFFIDSGARKALKQMYKGMKSKKWMKGGGVKVSTCIINRQKTNIRNDART